MGRLLDHIAILRVRLSDLEMNWRHRRRAPQCDTMIVEGRLVWKRRLASGETATVCVDCHRAVSLGLPPTKRKD